MAREKYWRIWQSEKKNSKFILVKFLPYVSSTCLVEYHVKVAMEEKKASARGCYRTTRIRQWVLLMYNHKSTKFKPANMLNLAFSPTFFPASISRYTVLIQKLLLLATRTTDISAQTNSLYTKQETCIQRHKSLSLMAESRIRLPWLFVIFNGLCQ